MTIKRCICAILLTVLIVGTMTACGKKTDYSFGTGNIGGNYYSYGNTLAGLIGGDDININVKSTAGSAANLRLIQKGFLDMAIVQSDVLLDAYDGKGLFDNNACDGVRVVAGLYMEECQIIVSADSDIYTVGDLYSKNVSVGEDESGVMQNAKQILAVNGLTVNNINASYLSFSDSAEALKSGAIDAFFCTAGAPTTSVQELSKEMDIRLISLDSRTCKQLIQEYPCYVERVIPAGTYQGQDEDVTTLGVKAVLVVSNKLSDDFVIAVTETLFTHSTELQYATSADAIDKEFAVEAIPVPFHSGAAKWYEQQGIQVGSSNGGSTGYGVDASQD